jgi:hypothetical protein
LITISRSSNARTAPVERIAPEKYEILVCHLGSVLADALNYVDEKAKRKKLTAKASGKEFADIQTEWPRHKRPFDSRPGRES